MKKITIGRGRECDIRLSDSTDKVSRRQAVITISPFGKMIIYDTSANGTYVNGEKLEKPNGRIIKRGDNVNFAHMIDLDWNSVKNPYPKVFLSILFGITFIVAVVFGFLFWREGKMSVHEDTQDPVKTELKDSVAQVNDSLILDIPHETPTPVLRLSPSKSTKETPKIRPESTVEEKSSHATEEPDNNNDPVLNEMINKKY